MKDDFELVRGSGNVFHDFCRINANVEQARAILAAEIICTLDKNGLSSREAEKLTGVAYSEFSRIRNARLKRFTLDRMITILGKLDEDVEVKVTFNPRHRVLQDSGGRICMMRGKGKITEDIISPAEDTDNWKVLSE